MLQAIYNTAPHSALKNQICCTIGGNQKHFMASTTYIELGVQQNYTTQSQDNSGTIKLVIEGTQNVFRDVSALT